ncbi:MULTISPECIES: ankyrin repeat domain-containing protein [Sphingobacterium]|uniref:ankyrin repeat domain-containing protein n=1 Tax=Sphingobacterium TaxID=28453 RepID=UPI000B494A88|nr:MULTISPECIES: ankyrin repeat domain-containing protein [Sphingobacterium]
MTNNELRTLAEFSRKGEIAEMERIVAEANNRVDFHDYELNSLVSQLIRAQHYGVLDHFVKKGLISTDLYDYDRFSTSVINTLFKPQIASEVQLEAHLIWMKGYLAQIDDINEEVGGITLLEYALQENVVIPFLKLIFEAGADLQRMDQYGQTLLFKVCSLRMQSNERISELVDWLLVEGLDPNIGNVEQKTALHMAVDTLKTDVVIKLLNAGADPGLKDWHGESSFYYAAVRHFNPDLLVPLLNYGSPDFHSVNKQGENLLNAFLRMMHTDSETNLSVLILLLEHGADLTAASLWYQKEKTGVDWLAEKSVLVVQEIMDKGYLDLSYADNEGNTLLHKICQVNLNYDENRARDLYKKVKYLVGEGIDPQLENIMDKKAVDYAMEDNIKVKTVEWLLKQ